MVSLICFMFPAKSNLSRAFVRTQPSLTFSFSLSRQSTLTCRIIHHWEPVLLGSFYIWKRWTSCNIWGNLWPVRSKILEFFMSSFDALKCFLFFVLFFPFYFSIILDVWVFDARVWFRLTRESSELIEKVSEPRETRFYVSKNDQEELKFPCTALYDGEIETVACTIVATPTTIMPHKCVLMHSRKMTTKLCWCRTNPREQLTAEFTFLTTDS